LAESGFSQIYTLECIERPFDVRVTKMSVLTVGPLDAPPPPPRKPTAAAAAGAAAAAAAEPIMAPVQLLQEETPGVALGHEPSLDPEHDAVGSAASRSFRKRPHSGDAVPPTLKRTFVNAQSTRKKDWRFFVVVV
jgi:hypothetical protein